MIGLFIFSPSTGKYAHGSHRKTQIFKSGHGKTRKREKADKEL
jgi:hypothetical protein